MKRLRVTDDYMLTWIIHNCKRIIFMRQKLSIANNYLFQGITILYPTMRMMFIPVVDQKCAHMFVVHHTHPSKMNLLACNNIYGCHLYTLDLLLAQSYIPLLLHKYGFIFCYFNYLLHLHKILMLVGIFECLCEFQQLAMVLKMFHQHKRGLINIYLYFKKL